jgi:sugar phosphate isomerase/epimerase
MKLTFSTQNVNRASFIDMCRYAYDYGFDGFEIYDAITERKHHYDSILRSNRMSDAKRKLVNRNLEVTALVVPHSVDSDDMTAELAVKYVDMAVRAGIERVIFIIGSI